MKKICLVLITLAMITSFASCGVGAQKIDMRDYVTVTYDSFNGYATAGFEVDSEALTAALDSEKVSKFAKKSVGFLFSGYGPLSAEDLFDFELAEDYTGLSNGDEVKVVVEIDSLFAELGVTLEQLEKELGIEIANKELTFTVEGLEEAKTFDIFVDIENVIRYEGANGSAKAEVYFGKDYTYQYGDFYFSGENAYYTNQVDVIHHNKKIGSITYYCDAKNLSNGDKITITTKTSFDGNLSDRGYIIPEKTKEYTVSGVGEYITSVDQLTGDLKEKVLTLLEEKVFEQRLASYVEFATYYTSQRNPGHENNWNSPISVIVIFKYTSGISDVGYYYAELYDIVLESDGTVKGSFIIDYTWNKTKTIEQKFGEFDVVNYTVVEIER